MSEGWQASHIAKKLIFKYSQKWRNLGKNIWIWTVDFPLLGLSYRAVCQVAVLSYAAGWAGGGGLTHSFKKKKVGKKLKINQKIF